MRRKDRELSVEESMRLLLDARYGTLCFGADDEGYPYAVPMNCALVDGKMIFHGAGVGAKYEALKRSGKARLVCVLSYSPVKETFSAKYESVIVKGEVSEVEDRDEKIAMLSAFTQIVLESDAPIFSDVIDKAIGKISIWAMSIEEVTGKRSPKA